MSEEQAEKTRERPAARVDRLLVQPLLAAGLRKQTRMKADDHDAMLHKLRERLGYLDERWFDALVDAVLRNAAGKHKNEWPDLVSILNWAAGLQLPKPGYSRLVTSYMRSAAGAAALAESPFKAAALLKWLLRFGRPPTPARDGRPGDWPAVDRWAQELADRHKWCARLVAEGAPDAAPGEWLAAFDRNDQLVRDLVKGVVPEAVS